MRGLRSRTPGPLGALLFLLREPTVSSRPNTVHTRPSLVCKEPLRTHAPGSDPLWAEPGAGSARMRRGRPYRCPGYTPLSLPWTVSPGPGTHAFLSFLWLLNIVGGGGKRNLRGSLQRVSEMLCRTGLPPCLPRGVREDRTSSSSLVPLPVFSRRRSTGLSRKHR